VDDPSGQIGKRRGADVAMLVVLAGTSALYCYDAVRASTHIYNLILVAPLTALVMILCVAEFVTGARSSGNAPPPAEPVTDVLPVMGLFSAYVLTLNWLGFDVGTALFVGAFLWLQGERRLPWLVGYSLTFALTLTLFFSRMLPYPMPTLLPGITGAGG
jgi:hypothetical protein